MTPSIDEIVNGLKDELLEALTHHTAPDHVAIALLKSVAPDCVLQQEDGSLTLKSPHGQQSLMLTYTVGATALHLVKQAAEAGTQIMDLCLGGNEQAAVAELIDAIIWLAGQLPDAPDITVIPSLCIEHVTEMVPSMDCEGVFAYLDARIAEFKARHLATRSQRSLLKACNLLLKRLSKSHNAMLCGRIHLFLAKFLPLEERSGLNAAGNFDLQNTTVPEDVEPEALDSQGQPVDALFYKHFWSLQSYFSAPMLCLSPNNKWSDFSKLMRDVLERFKSEKVSVTEQPPGGGGAGAGSEGGQEGEQHGGSFGGINVKYLSNSRLLSLQLKDATFRRHFLIQCLLLMHFCENPQHKELPALKGKQLEDLKELRSKVYHALKSTPDKGPEFTAAVRRLIAVEDSWAAWKQAGCKEERLKVPPATMPQGAAETSIAAVPVKKKRKLSVDAVLGISVGTPELDRLWNIAPDNVSLLGADDRGGFKTLRQLMEPIIEELNEPTQDDDSKVSKDTMYSWKTLRILARDNLKVFAEAVNRGGDLDFAARSLYPTEVPPAPEPVPKQPEPEPEAATETAAAEEGQGDGADDNTIITTAATTAAAGEAGNQPAEGDAGTPATGTFGTNGIMTEGGDDLGLGMRADTEGEDTVVEGNVPIGMEGIEGGKVNHGLGAAAGDEDMLDAEQQNEDGNDDAKGDEDKDQQNVEEGVQAAGAEEQFASPEGHLLDAANDLHQEDEEEREEEFNQATSHEDNDNHEQAAGDAEDQDNEDENNNDGEYPRSGEDDDNEEGPTGSNSSTSKSRSDGDEDGQGEGSDEGSGSEPSSDEEGEIAVEEAEDFEVDDDFMG